VSLLDTIPGYLDAVEREAAIRDAAFLDMPESILGLQVNPLTIRIFLALNGIASPFVRGEAATAADVARFLWAVSPLYSPTYHKARANFVAGLRKLKAEPLTKAIRAYMDEAFLDAPAANTEGESGAPFASWASALVDFLASQYSWSEREILDMPLKRAWQYVRRIQKRKNPKQAQFNPSDKVRGDWLATVNQMKGENGI